MENTTNTARKVPTGVVIIAIVYFMNTIFAIVAAAMMLIMGVFLLPEIGTMFAKFLIIFAVISTFIAIGIWKLKHWARFVAIIVSLLVFIVGVGTIRDSGGIANAIFLLVTNAFVVMYLIFNKKVKNAFEKKPAILSVTSVQ